MSGTAAARALEIVPETMSSETLPNAMSPAEPTRDLDVAAIAYRLWEERGCPQGDAERDWYEAERQAQLMNGSE